MRNLGLVCCVVLVLGACAAAQHAEFTGAYSHLTGPVGKDGFDFSAAYLPVKYLGVEADAGGYYANSGNDNVYTYAGGPTVKFSKHYHVVTPFVHLLFGGAREFGTNYFAVLGGGGVDIGSKKVALRFKLDAVNFNKDTHARVGLGLMVRP
jgi:hypothetical protein